MRPRTSTVGAALAVALGACPEPAQPESPEPRPPVTTATAGAPATDVRGTGAPCGADECGDGTCLPLPGGYCTRWCSGSAACGDDARCVPTVRAGELCLDACETDADCRADQGYQCHPDYKGCMVPGFVGPRPPSCEGAPPAPRKAFSEPRMLSTPPRTKYAFEPTAALLPSGDLAVAYIAMNGIFDDNDLETVVVRADGTIDPPRSLGSSKKRHFDPWMTTFGEEAVLVWLGHDGGMPDLDPTIAMVRSKDGVGWSTPVGVADEADCPPGTRGCLDKPMVIGSIAPKGKKPSLAVLYYSEVTEGLRARASGDASTFAPSSAALGGAYGDVFADAAGGLAAVAVTFGEGSGRPNQFGDVRARIDLTTSSDGGATWTAPKTVSDEGESVPFYFSNPQVVVDAKRKRTHVIYPAGTPDGRWDIFLRTSADGGKTWTKRKVHEDPTCATHMKPVAALDPKTGDVLVLWADNRDGKGRMIFSSCGKDACTPGEAVSEPFAAFGFVRHAPAWVGEYDALVFDEKRRVLHAVFTAVVDEKGVPTSRVFYASAKL